MYFSASSDEAAAATIEDGPEPASAPGFDAVALGGIEPVVQMGALEGLLTGVDHLPHTHNLAKNAFTKGEPEHGGLDAGGVRAVALRLDHRLDVGDGECAEDAC